MTGFKQIKLDVLTILLAVLLSGCSYQRELKLPAVTLPEGVFTMPDANNFGAARAAVFSFAEPSYAAGAGKVAADLLCRKLEEKNVFGEVVFEPALLDMTLRHVIELGRKKGYDLLITGEIIYLFEGSFLHPSSVSEQIRVVKLRGEKPVTLWYAKAVETRAPALSTDYIVAQGKGQAAPAPTVLMQRNAEKFCNMLLNVPPRPSNSSSDLDMKSPPPHEPSPP